MKKKKEIPAFLQKKEKKHLAYGLDEEGEQRWERNGSRTKEGEGENSRKSVTWLAVPDGEALERPMTYDSMWRHHKDLSRGKGF